VGRGPDAAVYHVEVPNVATLESNSPVLIDDVVIGSIGKTQDNYNPAGGGSQAFWGNEVCATGDVSPMWVGRKRVIRRTGSGLFGA
ncbi:MAG TPA: hypothetical protein VLQ48_13070, partial [Chloroflexia bacterium]|nr:hypothetical protein [Chloroflexia bacterium]